MNNDGGTAFPFHWKGPDTERGMTLHQWYAGMALQGLLAHGAGDKHDSPDLAKRALARADAMIAAYEARK